MLSDMVALQREFDERHGWNLKASSAEESLDIIGRELVGLIGEVGEFANIVKKLQLLRRFPDELAAEYKNAWPNLSDELVDVLIYTIRLAGLVEVDLDEAYQKKLCINETRFRRFEQ